MSEAVHPGSGKMFDQIAGRYDLLNRLMSMGIDQSWRRKTVAALALPADARVLDLATGTGDLALMIARLHQDAKVVGSDPSSRMLEVGVEKVARSGLADRVQLELGDAQSLPYEDDSFDGCCIAFGIRNVPDRSAALAEMSRVTKPGGRVAVLVGIVAVLGVSAKSFHGLAGCFRARASTSTFRSRSPHFRPPMISPSRCRPPA